MTFNLPEAWVWDFWLADDGEQYHLFFLYASRALKKPDLRHYRAQIGHAVSTDLKHWERVTDALVREDGPAFDDLATWTGSVVRDDAGLWHLFYTGATRAGAMSNIQRIGHATSPDLLLWTRVGAEPVLQASEPYETLATGEWHDEAFRDPWVFRSDDQTWHMLITARTNKGDPAERGVVGHAVSTDLVRWHLREPLSVGGTGFGQLEVTQAAEESKGVPCSCSPAEPESSHPSGSRPEQQVAFGLLRRHRSPARTTLPLPTN